MPILATGAGAGGSWLIIIAYVVIIIGFMYFIAIRPQKKQEKKQKALMESVEIGDSVLTTSGFYGVVIDTTGRHIYHFSNMRQEWGTRRASFTDEMTERQQNSVW